MKYIIKNCPAIYSDVNCKEYTYEDGSVECKNRTDCLLKQITEKCKENYGNENHRLADEILNLLEIEELNE